MLFNSWEFILLFLPLALAGYRLLARYGSVPAMAWLTVASLFFYGWWNAGFLPLLLASIGFNYAMGLAIHRAPAAAARRWLVFALAGNLIALGYWKYLDLAIDSVNTLAGTAWPLQHLVLPIGISFFTFTQIAYLVDVHRGRVREFRPLNYTLFVSYFPHLIAGPVIHHADVMPQFQRRPTGSAFWPDIAFGLSLFTLGLAKKLLIADPLSAYVGPVFDAPASPMAVEAWGAALAYTLQLYFDFSGYSDMAVGLSRLFGIDLPVNFNSPYKAQNIAEFWRRWHMTLSRFLRDYLYIPLGGNRHGGGLRTRNLLLTMLLGGLWHGAAWTFVVWGGLHGLYLVLHQGWQAVKARSRLGAQLDGRRSYRAFSQALCFAAVVVGWVFFRAPSLGSAFEMLSGMAGLHGAGWPTAVAGMLGSAETGGAGRFSATQAGWLLAAMGIAFFAPNSMQWLAGLDPRAVAVGDSRPAGGARWRLSGAFACGTGLLAVACLLRLNRGSEFLYFQF